MLSISVIRAGDQASSYANYQESEVSQVREDYYAGEGDAGHWLGSAASEMGLVDQLEPGQLLSGLQGFHPGTGEVLASNAGQEHKGGWDLTFSAPKSVSCIWSVCDPDTRANIEFAQNIAAEKALVFLEQSGAFLSRSRTDHGPVAGVTAARFMHGTSREADPQIHTHVSVLNLQPDGSAMDFDTRWKLAGGAVYRAELALEFQKMGFGIERDGNSFRVAGVPQTLENEFSTRRKQIKEALKLMGMNSAKAAEIAALDTRKGKSLSTKSELFQDWQQRAELHHFNRETIVSLQHAERQDKEVVPAEIFSKLTEQASTFTPQQMAAAVAIQMQDIGGADQIKDFIRQLEKHRELIRLESDKPRHLQRGEPTEIRYTTLEMLEIETGILNRCQLRHQQTCHIVPVDAAINARPSMSEEQQNALRHICEKRGSVQLIQGMAGTGKSYLMSAARESWEANGFEVVGATLAGKAAAGLESSAGIKSQTLHSLLSEIDAGKTFNNKTVLVLDEAGMIGSRQMGKLLDSVHESGAKVVLIGDTQQLQPIDAGASFRLLAQNIGAARLENIVRQKNAEDRQVVRDFADGRSAEALESMKERGLLNATETHQQAMTEMVKDWALARDSSKPGECLMLAATRAEVKQLNTFAREILKGEGLLASSVSIPTAGGMKEFACGDRIMFGRNSAGLGVKNGDLAMVQQIQFTRDGEIEITAKLDNGRIAKFVAGENKNQFSHFDYGYAMSVHKAQGVTVDKAFVLPSDTMSGREWSYVAASRARHETKIYTTNDQVDSLSRTMGRSNQKETSLDFNIVKDAPELANLHASKSKIEIEYAP